MKAGWPRTVRHWPGVNLILTWKHCTLTQPIRFGQNHFNSYLSISHILGETHIAHMTWCFFCHATLKSANIFIRTFHFGVAVYSLWQCLPVSLSFSIETPATRLEKFGCKEPIYWSVCIHPFELFVTGNCSRFQATRSIFIVLYCDVDSVMTHVFYCAGLYWNLHFATSFLILLHYPFY